ncbi:hypothetical protein JMJ77_0004830, partial [Colletotrichum scovillei]
SITRLIPSSVTCVIGPQSKPDRSSSRLEHKSFYQDYQAHKREGILDPRVDQNQRGGGGSGCANLNQLHDAIQRPRFSLVQVEPARQLAQASQHRRRYGERSNWSHERYPPAWVELLLACSGAVHPWQLGARTGGPLVSQRADSTKGSLTFESLSLAYNSCHLRLGEGGSDSTPSKSAEIQDR